MIGVLFISRSDMYPEWQKKPLHLVTEQDIRIPPWRDLANYQWIVLRLSPISIYVIKSPSGARVAMTVEMFMNQAFNLKV